MATGRDHRHRARTRTRTRRARVSSGKQGLYSFPEHVYGYLMDISRCGSKRNGAARLRNSKQLTAQRTPA